MTGKLFDPHLDLLEQRFQTLLDQIGARPELEGALQELSQAIAALRANREAGGTLEPAPPAGREAQAGQADKQPSPMSPETLPGPCEAMLRHVLNAIPDLLTVHDQDFNTILSNWHGYESVPEAERQVRPKCYRVYHHREQPCDHCHAVEVMATGQPLMVTKVNSADGRVREVSAFPIRDESGRVVLVVEHLRDITDLHLATEALRASEAKYRELVENASSIILRLDTQGKVTFFNEFAQSFFGYREEEIIGRHVVGTIVPEKDAKGYDLAAKLRDVVKHPERYYSSENENMRRNGERVWVAWTNKAVRDRDGKLNELLCIGIDRTEHRRAEEALKDSEAIFRTLIEDSPESLFLTDVQGTILAASRVAAQRLGKSLAEVTGANSFDLFPPEVAAKRRDLLKKALATRRPFRLEDARDDFHFDVHITPILDADGKVSRLSILATDITDRKNAEQALKESEATLRTLIEANPESLFLLDTRGMILAASHVAAQRLGKSLKEIIGTDLHDMLPPEVSKRRFEIMQEVIATGQPARFEDVRGDIYFDSSITPIFDQGQVVQIAVLGVDISLRKLAEQALKDSEARFRAIFATAQDTVFIKDRSLRYTQVNPAMARLYGQAAAEIVGKTDLDLVGAAEAERIWKQDRRVLGGEVVKGAHTVSVQGVPIKFHYIKAPLRDEAGEIVGICGIARDISDLRRAEEALEESEERFRMLFDHVPDAYILADMQGEIIDCNQAAEDLAGYGREELVGNNFACLPWLDFRQQVRLADLLAQTARGEIMGPVDFNLTRKDGGEVIAEGMSLPLYIQGQNLVLTIIRDITARKRAEAGLRESEERFRMLFEHAPDSYILSNNQGEIIDCNKATDELTGYSREELIGNNFVRLPILDLQQQIRMTELLAQAAPGEVLGRWTSASSARMGEKYWSKARACR
jgi:PAS domain S-box-containing protein